RGEVVIMRGLPKMLTDMVLLKILKEKKTASGLFLPDDVVDMKISAAGEAVAVGPDVKTVTVGDMCYYKNLVGNMIQDDTLPQSDMYFYLVVSEKDVLGIKSKLITN